MRLIKVTGGLGNQMFIYACYLQMKKRFPRVYIDLTDMMHYHVHYGYEMHRVFGLPCVEVCMNQVLKKVIEFLFFKTILERKQHGSMRPYTRSYLWPLIYFKGFYQSEKYFADIKDEVRQAFTFDLKQANGQSLRMREQIDKDEHAVSLHVRRGDYLQPKHWEAIGCICQLSYYRNALEEMGKRVERPRYYVFSDDLAWVKENLDLPDAVYIDWNKGEDSWQDMMLMSRCRHHIICNSTFSWWGAWLNPRNGKIVIAPERWTRDADSREIVPAEWLRDLLNKRSEDMRMYMMRKIGYALVEIFKTFRRISSPRLIMTLLVKNEEDMLEENLRFHKAMGVDGFIITDNNSTDRTPEIIEKYRQMGWVKEVIQETATNYEQKAWVDRMIWKAKTRYGADWIINADADELWYAPSGNLKDELSRTGANVLNCEMRSLYPEEDKPFWQWDKAVKYVPDLEHYGLSLYSLFERQNKKVVHRAAGYIQISMGNHKVTMLPKRSADTDIRVYHYNIRGKQQFLEKMINGGKQLEQHKGRHGGRHWRYFYRLYKEGKLEEEYDRVIGTHVFDRLQADGYVYEDDTICRFFEEKM